MDYITAIGKGFPGVECHAVGDGTVYEDIVWDGGVALPSKTTLDEWIAANSTTVQDYKITVLAFRNRFTTTEKVTLDLASIDNPSASMQQRQLAAMLRVMQQDLAVANYVDLARTETINGLHVLETYGILGTGRANEILSAPITEIERPPVMHTIVE